MLKPDVEDVVDGAKGPLDARRTTSPDRRPIPDRGRVHGATRTRWRRARTSATARGSSRSISSKQIFVFADGTEVTYRRLISTVPLPDLIKGAHRRARGSAARRFDAAVVAVLPRSTSPSITHAGATRSGTYIYDEDKLSVRLSLTEVFAAQRPPGQDRDPGRGVRLGVPPVPTDHDEVRRVDQLVEMGLLDGRDAVESVRVTFVPQGNPIFDLNRRAAIAEITEYLERVGVLLPAAMRSGST